MDEGVQSARNAEEKAKKTITDVRDSSLLYTRRVSRQTNVYLMPFPGCHDGRGAEEGVGHQRPPGEDEEEPGGHRQRPAAAPGRRREPGHERQQEAAPKA